VVSFRIRYFLFLSQACPLQTVLNNATNKQATNGCNGCDDRREQSTENRRPFEINYCFFDRIETEFNVSPP
jgi:hypothetical protein